MVVNRLGLVMQNRPDKPSAVLRRLAARLRNTPLHPQWFALFREDRKLERICASLSGIVLDVGCAHGKPRRHLPASAHYLGVDYYSTAREWYGTRPDLFADARSLPLADDSVDHSLLLDVLEHVPHPNRCLAELHRVLKPGGTLTVQVPFLYPVHDAPLDFHRWTRFGLAQAALDHGFRVERESATGRPLETAALTANIALSRSVLSWLERKHPLALTALALPLAVPLINCLGWLFGALNRDDDLMPYAYTVVWVKD
jgi:SAM-dependent methyltransferase